MHVASMTSSSPVIILEWLSHKYGCRKSDNYSQTRTFHTKFTRLHHNMKVTATIPKRPRGWISGLTAQKSKFCEQQQG